jgi:hypothetical protein
LAGIDRHDLVGVCHRDVDRAGDRLRVIAVGWLPTVNVFRTVLFLAAIFILGGVALLFDGSWTGVAVFGGPAALAVLVAMALRKPAASRRKRF